MSKGSKTRPMTVTEEEYATRWEAIFGTDLKEEVVIVNADELLEIMEPENENINLA